MTFLLHRCMSPLAWISDSGIGTVLVYFVQIAQCTALSLYRNTRIKRLTRQVQPTRKIAHAGSRTGGPPILLWGLNAVFWKTRKTLAYSAGKRVCRPKSPPTSVSQQGRIEATSEKVCI
jgi:hypothetical protein